jgi:hypothetical protein
MRLLGLRRPRFSQRFLCPGLIALATACSVYDVDPPADRADGGGSAGSGGTGGTAGSGGVAGTGPAGSGGTAGSDGAADGATIDATRTDADAARIDVALPPSDALDDGTNDALETGGPDDGGTIDTLPPADADTADASDTSRPDTADVVAPPIDVSFDSVVGPDADGAARDADAPNPDASDGGPTGPQILPQHGSPIEKPDAGGPFDSRCASDEVVTGFIGRAGVQTDAIASTCSKLIGGVLSAPHNLTLNGFPTGGNAFTVVCPANYVAVGIVGRYGHNTMWMEDVTTMIGVICKDLASSTTQTVTITGQPALDSGYTSFREDCAGGRYLTDISGRIDSNSLGVTVQQVGGECDFR